MDGNDGQTALVRRGWEAIRAVLRSESCSGLKWPAGMSRADRRAWYAATTLHDLGELTARWLERDLDSQPGYRAGCGPDEETAHLVPILARLCRAGYVTDGSQPGQLDDSLPDEPPYAQRAAVEGFCTPETATVLHEAAADAGLLVVDAVPAGWRYDYSNVIDVSALGEQMVTSFGARPTPRDLRSLRFAECCDEMLDVLCRSRYVTVVDPVWGRDNVLWPALELALTRATQQDQPNERN